MYKKNVLLYSILLVIATLFLGIAYANIANIDMYISGDALIIPNENIEITAATYKDSLNANLTDSKVLTNAKTMMQSVVKLDNNIDSYITYTITIKNNTSNDLYYIDTIKNDAFYTNEFNELNTQIVYELNGINKYDKIDKNGGEITFDITFKYADNLDEIHTKNEILNSYLNFRFREVYSITYIGIKNNDYPDKLISGEEYIIPFIDDLPDNITITGDVSSSYINGILTLKDIKSDIVIIEGDEE